MPLIKITFQFIKSGVISVPNSDVSTQLVRKYKFLMQNKVSVIDIFISIVCK